MEAADWTGIGVCVKLVEGVGGGEIRQLAFFGGSLSWHLGGHQAVARAGGLQVPGAEAASAVGCSSLSSQHPSSHLGAPEGTNSTVLFSITRGQPRHIDFGFSNYGSKLGWRGERNQVQCQAGEKTEHVHANDLALFHPEYVKDSSKERAMCQTAFEAGSRQSG